VPKLNAETSNQNRMQIEKAALKRFLQIGFNGVTVREIAKEANVSLGNIYTYFPDKTSIFRAVLKQQEQEFLDPQNPVIQYFINSDFPKDLALLGKVIGENVDKFDGYFKLIYIDLIEFDGVHVRELFSDLDQKFSTVMKKKFREVGKLGPDKSIDPSFALTAIYLTFYQYFTLTRIFGAKNVYGKISDAKVIDKLIDLFSGGIK
jgi:AcrR family transcriptional regulator